MTDDNDHDGDEPWPAADSRPPQPTLALLADVTAVLLRHGYPPEAYPLAELTGSLYRIAETNP